MAVLIDTNVIIDFLMTREPFYKASTEIIKMCAEGKLKGYIAFHSVPNLWYILRRVPEDKRREWLADICSFLQVVGTSHEEVIKAVKMEEFKDFEDCLQDKCAKSAGAEYIITRNVDDFKNSDIAAILPEDLLKLVSCSCLDDAPKVEW